MHNGNLKKNNNNNSISNLAKALMATPEAHNLIKASGAKTFDDLIGKEGLVANMLQPVIQELLDAEITEHLGYLKHHSSGYLTGNSRNGKYRRTMRSTD